MPELTEPGLRKSLDSLRSLMPSFLGGTLIAAIAVAIAWQKITGDEAGGWLIGGALVLIAGAIWTVERMLTGYLRLKSQKEAHD
ncbi:MAG TPA: hypothetical protein VF885_20170 [Arthrobacter sp.]